jgi:hypothetical protein
MFENGCFLRRQKRFKLPHKESSSSRRKKVQLSHRTISKTFQDRTVKQERQQHPLLYDENSLIKQEFKSNIHIENSPNIDPSELARLSSNKSDELNGSPTGRLEVSFKILAKKSIISFFSLNRPL